MLDRYQYVHYVTDTKASAAKYPEEAWNELGERLGEKITRDDVPPIFTVLEGEKARISLSDPNSSALIEESEGGDSLYVVMPMRL